MTRKSALQKIEAHEKLCRIMQRQTFDQIKELKAQIVRIERLLIGTAAFIIISLILIRNIIKKIRIKIISIIIPARPVLPSIPIQLPLLLWLP